MKNSVTGLVPAKSTGTGQGIRTKVTYNISLELYFCNLGLGKFLIWMTSHKFVTNMVQFSKPANLIKGVDTTEAVSSSDFHSSDFSYDDV